MGRYGRPPARPDFAEGQSSSYMPLVDWKIFMRVSSELRYKVHLALAVAAWTYLKEEPMWSQVVVGEAFRLAPHGARAELALRDNRPVEVGV
jgi:hypothetical protein